MRNELIVILGCTATGKTQLAANLAYRLDAELVSADSRQVYRGMDIGTGKDLNDLVVNGTAIPYHLIDICEAGEEYNVFQYQKDFLEVYASLQERRKLPVLCGGTGLYLEAVLKGYRFVEVPENKVLRAELEQLPVEELVQMLSGYKELHNTTDTIHKKRTIRAIEVAKFEQEHEAFIRDFPKMDAHIFGIRFDRETIRDRITKRLKYRLDQEGMIEEVQGLLNRGITAEKLKYYGLEYKFITRYLLGELNREELFEQLNIAIHQFAKRQATWFRKMERHGFQIDWIDGNLSLDEKIMEIQKKLGNFKG